MSDDRRYSRVYHEAPGDERFATVWLSDPNLALWLRLLVLADGAWPAPAPIPRSARSAPLAALVAAGLVELVSGDLYLIHGMKAERSRRSAHASRAAGVRWHGESNASGTAPSTAAGNAQTMLVQDKTRQDETIARPRARDEQDPEKGGRGPTDRAIEATKREAERLRSIKPVEGSLADRVATDLDMEKLGWKVVDGS